MGREETGAATMGRVMPILLIALLGCDQPGEPISPPSAPDAVSGNLIQTLMNRDLETAKHLIEAGADLEATNRFGDTPLIWASSLGASDIAADLLDRGARVETRGSRGRTALHWAAAMGHDEIAAMLLRRGAPVDRSDDEGRTPLITAAAKGHIALVKRLLEAGADPNHRDVAEESALFSAIRGESPVAVEMLLEAGADPNQISLNGQSPIGLALSLNRKSYFTSRGARAYIPEIASSVEASYRLEDNRDDRPRYDIAELERAVHERINAERARHDLAPLTFDPALAAIARDHSENMLAEGFFSHTDPEGRDPTRRALAAKYPIFREVGEANRVGIGENIYSCSTFTTSATVYHGDVKEVTYEWISPEQLVEKTVIGWMTSPGHRRNVLEPAYIHQGIGIAIGSDEKVMVTQNLW